MRRIALLGLTLFLPACQSYVGSPFVGFGGFIADTHSFSGGPNRPPGNSPNMLRVEGQEAELEPLTPEPGNVWPRAEAPVPTLMDLEHEQNPQEFPAQPSPGPATRGSSTPPGPAALAPPPAPAARPAPPPALPPATPPSIQVLPTPRGPAVSTQTGNGVQTYTDPKGGTGIVVPNGNGTSTLIGPDGTITTVPNATVPNGR